MRDVKIIKIGVMQYRVARAMRLVKASSMPDEIIVVAGADWDNGGYSSWIVYRVAERGIPFDMMDHAMNHLVGPCWKDTSCGSWMDMIEAKGIEDFKFSRELYGPRIGYEPGDEAFEISSSIKEEPPIADVFTDLILKYEQGWWRE